MTHSHLAPPVPSGPAYPRARRSSLLIKSILVGLSLLGIAQAAPVPPTDNTAAPYMGLYGGHIRYDAAVSNIDVTTAWLNRSKLFLFDLGGYDSWAYIEGIHQTMDAAQNWLQSNPGGTFCYTTCMLPGYNATPAAGTSLANGAAGLYDAHFAALAGKLASRGLANNTIVRIGHEFTGNWYPWKVLSTTDATHYVNYWRRIVTAMRAVPGAENLRFEWCGMVMQNRPYTLDQVYPGDAYVDYIGCDVYDSCPYAGTYGDPYPTGLTAQELLQRRRTAWNYLSRVTWFGLYAWRDFAAARGKPMTISEWGHSNSSTGGQDNPVFMQNMYDFIQDPANNVYYHSYFDVVTPKAHHQLTQLPNGDPTVFPVAAKLFRKLFGMKPFPLNNDIGSVGLAGTSAVETLTGAGTGFRQATTTDSFNFSSRTITGDDELILGLPSLPASTTAQSGAMLRQNTTSNAAYVALYVSNGKCVLQSRDAAGANSLLIATVNNVTAPVWLKLTRKGNTSTGYLSNDGLNWTLVGNQTVAMTGTAHLGVAVSSGSTTALVTATVDKVDYPDIQTNDTALIAGALTLDNEASSGVAPTGSWPAATVEAPFVGLNYLTDGNTAKGTKSVRYSPTLAQAGDYDAYVRWPAAWNHAYNTPISVTSTAGTASFVANQESGRNLWNHLGAFPFSAGSTGNILIGTTGTTGTVVADSVMFVRRPVTTTVTCAADSYVRDGGTSATNYGPFNNLDVKTDAPGYNRYSFLRFGVSGGLSTAKLVQLQLTPITSNSTTVTYTIEFVSDDTWTETGITWDNQPAASGTVLGSLTMSGLKVGVPVSIDITNQVRTEAAGDGKISLRIRADVSNTSSTYLGFASRTNGTAAYRPRLLVQ